MTITNKLRLSFAIFLSSLLIPAFVGLNAISAIRHYQTVMEDISDLSFTQMKFANAIGAVITVFESDKLATLEAHAMDVQANFSEQVGSLTQLNNKALAEYAQTIIDDEKALVTLSKQLFDSHEAYLASTDALNKKLEQYHYAPPEFMRLVAKADDKSIIETLVNINNTGSFAMYNGMKEADVSQWLEAIAELKQKMLHNPNLAEHQAEVTDNIAKRRAFIVSMVDTAREHLLYEQKEHELVQQFVQMVERNIEHGQHSKHQLMANIEATAERTIYLKGAVISFMLFIGILISMYLTGSIARSVTNMKNAVNKVSEGNLDTIMRESGKNEFATLADAFNHMTGELKNARQEMNEHNLTLEQRIAERTVELKEAIEQVEQNNRSLEKLSAQLSKYLSPQVFQSIFSGQREVRLETSRKKLTVFFSDIQGFTQLTDTMDPEAMTMVLNVYLNAMTEIALEYGGTIDKFIGDAVMVFFGDPQSKGHQQDAIDCVHMALAMRNKMRELKQYWQTQGYDLPFHIRMGINTGYCTVGNFGAEDRMDYTIIGGNVNLASRLESHAQPDQILISHTTEQLVKDNVQINRLDEIKVKGIATPVATFEVLGRQDEPLDTTTIQRSQQGLALELNLNEIDRQAALNQLQSVVELLQSQSADDLNSKPQ